MIPIQYSEFHRLGNTLCKSITTGQNNIFKLILHLTKTWRVELNCDGKESFKVGQQIFWQRTKKKKTIGTKILFTNRKKI